MARLLLLSLLGVVLLSFGGQGNAQPSSAVSSASDEDFPRSWRNLWWHSWDDSDSDSSDSSDSSEDSSDDEDFDYEDGAVGSSIYFPIDDLDDEELVLYMNLEDQILLGEADEHIAGKLIQERHALYSRGDRPRRKRIAPLVGRVAFSVGRALFRQFSRGRLTRSGSRLTRHYSRPGNYQDAVRDFNRLRPDNVRTFQGRISGRTGTVGNHRVTVRDGSSGNSRPTLEVRSHGGEMVRKFRYNP